MKLVRNTTDDGKCKYALVRLDKLRKERHEQKEGGFFLKLDLAGVEYPRDEMVDRALDILEAAGLLEYGEKGTRQEHFVMKLHDPNSVHALAAYSSSVRAEDPELSDQVYELAHRAQKFIRAGTAHQPD